jgi:signal transduction histidine kinase
LGLDSLGRRVGKIAPEETGHLAALSDQLNTSCVEVRGIAYLMSPPTLDQQGLAPSLELLLRNSLQPSGIQTQFEQQNVPSNLDEKVKIGLYRIAQELIQNVVKHAEATTVKMRLFAENNQLIMKLEDNGKGFDLDNARKKGSMGLLNILSRVSNLNGTFKVETAKPSGSIATVIIMQN